MTPAGISSFAFEETGSEKLGDNPRPVGLRFKLRTDSDLEKQSHLLGNIPPVSYTLFCLLGFRPSAVQSLPLITSQFLGLSATPHSSGVARACSKSPPHSLSPSLCLALFSPGGFFESTLPCFAPGLMVKTEALASDGHGFQAGHSCLLVACLGRVALLL